MNRRLLPFFSALFFFACNNEAGRDEKEPAALPPQYYYFPRANVYFDSANKDYLFLASNDTSWQIAKQIPNVMKGLMDKSVFIPNPPQPVWKDNGQHKLIYSAVLYATPNDTVAKKEPPKSVVKKTSRSPRKEKKERNGIDRFVDKIVGLFKKDKKKKDSAQ